MLPVTASAMLAESRKRQVSSQELPKVLWVEVLGEFSRWVKVARWVPVRGWVGAKVRLYEVSTNGKS
jgi:hypothetical protein